ncbi:outer membrane homotrimeric porin [Fundidesulfovibrio agrisoli]|uniref:outer membrane homotrimeric porin n=1 Tax=Fundidesulfovibrio agrisoli TaxID=2922717 RepID=UPI001FAB74A9|nr:outer membrane homotrimeric porin [Fundidesulfovibrio agrisoli]
MKRLGLLGLCFSLLLGLAGQSAAATEVKMVGDARVHANVWSNIDYTGWNANGTRTGDPTTIWERFRLRTDFIANEGLKFRFGIRVQNRIWGNDTFTVDNPTVAIDVYQAFLQFKWPGTNVEFSIGMQDFDLPMSNPMLASSPVIGGTRLAAAIVSIPVCDAFKVNGGFARLLDTYKDFDPTTTQIADEFDAYFMTLPITLQGFAATPWAMIGVAGRDAGYFNVGTGSMRNSAESLASNLFSAGTYLAPRGFSNAQNLYFWVGTSMSVTVLDPFKFYADVIYGEGNASDRGKNRRGGLFFDIAAEYTGLDIVTPQVTFWYSTGEDSSTTNGSERLPTIVQNWGPSNSFLFDCTQQFVNGHMALNPTGSWGFAVSLNKVSFIQDLTHRLTFTFAQGTNSPRGLRNANLLAGTGNYVQLGRDLATTENLLAINFDNEYKIYENLSAVVETGWAHGNFDKSVWGRRFVNAANSGDAWKVAFGVTYRF